MGKEKSSCFLFNSPNKTIRITSNCNGVGIDVDITLNDLFPRGSTAQRPGTPTEGPASLRYNTTLHDFEWWNGSDWVQAGTGGGGTPVSGLYEGVSPTNVTVGALLAGTDITGWTLSEVLEAMLVTYLEPYFTAFSISGLAAAYEVGTSLSGSRAFSWSFAHLENVATATLDIQDVTLGTSLANNISIISPVSKVISASSNTPATHTWRLTATSTQGDNFSVDFSINFYYSRYWGYTDTPTPDGADILANASELASGKAKSLFTIPVVGTDQYIYFVYPTSFGPLSSIVIGGFESLATFNQTTETYTNSQGVSVNCYVYVSQNTFSVDVTNVVTT